MKKYLSKHINGYSKENLVLYKQFKRKMMLIIEQASYPKHLSHIVSLNFFTLKLLKQSSSAL